MKLKLPEVVRSRIKKILTEKVRMPHFVMASVVAGFLVSILELACTGQVYLPILTYVTSMLGLRLQAIPLLAIYNLMFILPLLVILIAVVCGTRSQRLVELLEKHLAKTKLALAFLFLGFCVLLLMTT